MVKVPKIVKAEEIGTAAVELVRSRFPVAPDLPTRLIPRELTGRDLGIDLAAEVIHRGETTGYLLFFQIKGTTRSLSQDDKHIRFMYPVKNLCYAEQLAVPLVFTLVDLSSSSIYWLWLQEYINKHLAMEDPKWRSKSKKVLRIPKNQTFQGELVELIRIGGDASSNRDKKEAYSLMIKHRDEIESLPNLVAGRVEGESEYILGLLAAIERLRRMLASIENLRMFHDPLQQVGAYIRQTFLLPALTATADLEKTVRCDLLSTNTSILRKYGWNLVGLKESEPSPGLVAWMLACTVKNYIEALEIAMGISAIGRDKLRVESSDKRRKLGQ